MLTFRVGDPDRPRGHALLFFRDADDPDTAWATYLVVAPIQMDLGIRPMAFSRSADGSTKWIFVQLTGLNGFAVVDGGARTCAPRRTTARPVADSSFEARFASTSG